MTHASRAEFRAEMLARVPRWYSPALHFVFPAVAGLAIAVLALSRLDDLKAWQLALVPVFLVLGNAVEWHAHKGILHRRTRFLEVLYIRHTPQHHAMFVSDEMAISGWKEVRFVLLPGYGILAILAATSPIALLFFWLGQPNLAALWVASVVLYVLSYEWLHLAYHLPADSAIGRLPIVGRLRRHHQLHHSPSLMQRWNFNVTLPLWDHVRGTVYRAPSAAPGNPQPAPAVRRVR
jgi:hypothetical protein